MSIQPGHEELESMVKSALGREKTSRTLSITLYLFPILLILAASYYSYGVVDEAEEASASAKEALKDRKAEIESLTNIVAYLDAQIESKMEALASLDTVRDQLDEASSPSGLNQINIEAVKQNLDAIQQAAESDDKKIQAYVVVYSDDDLEGAKAWAANWNKRHEVEKTRVFLSDNGFYAVTLGGATDPEAAKNILHQARSNLKVRDAYMRLSVTWVEQSR